jgi:streptomycin 6-kinase
VEQITTRRVDQLAVELGFDRQRIIAWAFAQAVLSAWWSVEDNDQGWEYGIRCAEILSSLL